MRKAKGYARMTVLVPTHVKRGLTSEATKEGMTPGQKVRMILVAWWNTRNYPDKLGGSNG